MKKILYVSPVCHLVEVAAQMSVICTSESPIKSPEEGHGEVGSACAPKTV